MKLLKNTKPGKNNFLVIFIILFVCLFFGVFNTGVISESNSDEKFVAVKILDKVSSKNSKLDLEIGEEKKFKNLLIKILKCKNSEFDDNPEITAYLQVKDISNKSVPKDSVMLYLDSETEAVLIVQSNIEELKRSKSSVEEEFNKDQDEIKRIFKVVEGK